MKKIIIILIHTSFGWALCWAIRGIGREITSIQNALIALALGSPVIFSVISLNYYRKFNYTTPLMTAIMFVGFIILMDVFVVALLIEKSFAMFSSILGTWIPFALIFLSTYVAGLYSERSKR
jgi:predicted small secreted protein